MMRLIEPIVGSAGVRYLEGDGQGGRTARAGHDSLRRRLGRRHAADRGPLHERDGRDRQRPLDAARLSGRDPRPRRLAARRVRLPDPLRRSRHPHAGRPAGRARGHEPGGAEDEPRGSSRARHAHRQPRRLLGSEPPEGRLHGEPARGRDARGVQRARGAAQHDDGRGAEGRRRASRRGRRSARRTSSRSASCRGCTAGRPRRRSTSSRRSSRDGRSSSTATRARSRPATTTARRARTSSSRTRCGRRSSRRASTATSRATRRCRSASSPPRSRAGSTSSSARTRSRRPPASSRSSRATSTSVSGRSRPRTRSPRSALRSARRSAARSASRRRPGPGIVLKSETVGLAVALELPLVIVDVQRAGPSTGMPTKPEQADLLMVMFGRNSESPVPVLAASTPGDCFDVALEACRIALTYRTPVYLLSDAYLANGAEPWLIPDVDALPSLAIEFATKPNSEGRFLPYVRDPETLARQWALPGNARPRAPDRRPGEGGRDGQHLVRPGQPRRDDPSPRAEGGGHRGRHPRARGRRPGRRVAARARLGRHVRLHRGGRAARARGTAATSRTRTFATSTRCRATRARC